jgi:hypothetical protein
MTTDAPAWPEWANNSLACWELAIVCQRAEVEAGRKLTPAEMLAAVDTMRDACMASDKET